MGETTAVLNVSRACKRMWILIRLEAKEHFRKGVFTEKMFESGHIDQHVIKIDLVAFNRKIKKFISRLGKHYVQLFTGMMLTAEVASDHIFTGALIKLTYCSYIDYPRFNLNKWLEGR